MLSSWKLRETWGVFPFLMEIHRFCLKFWNFWNFEDFSVSTHQNTSKNPQISAKSADFQTNHFLDVVLLEVEREMRIFSIFDENPQISIEIHGFHAKIRRYSGFCTIHTKIHTEIRRFHHKSANFSGFYIREVLALHQVRSFKRKTKYYVQKCVGEESNN